MTEKREMVTKSDWKTFRDAGLLWWMNRMLHLFGWAIVIEIDDNGEIIGAYPAQCKFRGFDEKGESQGFSKLTNHIHDNISELLSDVDQT